MDVELGCAWTSLDLRHGWENKCVELSGNAKSSSFTTFLAEIDFPTKSLFHV